MAKQKFQIGDKVALIKQPYTVGTVGGYEYTRRMDRPWGANILTKKKKYLVRIENNFTQYFYADELQFADLHSLAEHLDKHGDIPKLSKKEREEMKQCKYCDVPFNEIEESKEEPGVCEYCVGQRKHISKINLRKSAYVDLEKFSIYGHEGDWLEVTEWTNGEGIDVLIHYANDHDETDHTFKLSYDEFTAIANIVNKFGYKIPIFTKSEQ